VAGWPQTDPYLMAGLMVLAGLVTSALVGAIVLLHKSGGTRGRSLADQEAERFATGVARGDFEGAERSLRWALALAPQTESIPPR
jgi:hypothetical protein